MLQYFRVKNFRNFNQLEIDLSASGNYDFNTECLSRGILNKSVILGDNLVGKTNLGIAILDVVKNLDWINSDIERDEEYTNSEFFYRFSFPEYTFEYKYIKNTPNRTTEITHEELVVNNKIIFSSYPERKLEEDSKNYLSKEEIVNNSKLFSRIHNPPKTFLSISEEGFFRKDLYGREQFFMLILLDFIKAMGIYYANKRSIQFCKKEDFYDGDDYYVSGTHPRILRKFLSDTGLKFPLKDSIKRPYLYNNSNLLQILDVYARIFNRRDFPSFYFIDDFDNGISERNLDILFKAFLKVTRCQIIFVGNNPSLISNDYLRPDGYLLMNSSEIKSLNRCTNKELRKSHNLSKIFCADGFKL